MVIRAAPLSKRLKRSSLVCQIGCPGGGKWRFDFQVEFQKPNGELCTPAKEFTLTLKNLTLDLEPQEMTWTNPSPGVYKGSVDLGIAADTEYEVTASGGDSLQGTEQAGRFQVNVVDGTNDFHTICLAGLLDPPKCRLQGASSVRSSQSPDRHRREPERSATASTKTAPAAYLPSPWPAYNLPAVSCLKGQPASGNWDIGIPNRP